MVCLVQQILRLFTHLCKEEWRQAKIFLIDVGADDTEFVSRALDGWRFRLESLGGGGGGRGPPTTCCACVKCVFQSPAGANCRLCPKVGPGTCTVSRSVGVRVVLCTLPGPLGPGEAVW